MGCGKSVPVADSTQGRAGVSSPDPKRAGDNKQPVSTTAWASPDKKEAPPPRAAVASKPSAWGGSGVGAEPPDPAHHQEPDTNVNGDFLKAHRAGSTVGTMQRGGSSVGTPQNTPVAPAKPPPAAIPEPMAKKSPAVGANKTADSPTAPAKKPAASPAVTPIKSGTEAKRDPEPAPAKKKPAATSPATSSPVARAPVRMDSLYDLPDEVLLKLFSYLSVKEIGRVARTCRKVAALLRNDDSWRTTAQHLTPFPVSKTESKWSRQVRPTRTALRAPRTFGVVLLGLQGSGKTSLLYALQHETDTSGIKQTIGFTLRQIGSQHGSTVAVGDTGGSVRARAAWSNYYAEMFGAFFVVDSGRPELFNEARDALAAVDAEPRFRGKPLVIVANNRTRGPRQTTAQLTAALALDRLTSPHVLYRVNVRAADPLIERAFAWLVDGVQLQFEALNARVERDSAEQEARLEAEKAAKKAEVAARKQQLREEEERLKAGKK